MYWSGAHVWELVLCKPFWCMYMCLETVPIHTCTQKPCYFHVNSHTWTNIHVFDHFFILLLMLCGCTFYRADVQFKYEFILSCDSHVTNVFHRKCYHSIDMSCDNHMTIMFYGTCYHIIPRFEFEVNITLQYTYQSCLQSD